MKYNVDVSFSFQRIIPKRCNRARHLWKLPRAEFHVRCVFFLCQARYHFILGVACHVRWDVMPDIISVVCHIGWDVSMTDSVDIMWEWMTLQIKCHVKQDVILYGCYVGWDVILGGMSFQVKCHTRRNTSSDYIQFQMGNCARCDVTKKSFM